MSLIEILMTIDEQPSGPNKVKWASKFMIDMGVDAAVIKAILASMDSKGNFVNVLNQPITVAYTVN